MVSHWSRKRNTDNCMSSKYTQIQPKSVCFRFPLADDSCVLTNILCSYKTKMGIYEVELLSNRSQEEHILTKICCVLVFVFESKLYQYRGSNSSSSYQLCKKITVSKHFTQHTLYSPDTSFKNMTICANELSCSSSCQRIRERNTPPCFLSFFLCKSDSSRCHSLYKSKYHPCD